MMTFFKVKSAEFLVLVIDSDRKWDLRPDGVRKDICSPIFEMKNWKKYLIRSTLLIKL